MSWDEGLVAELRPYAVYLVRLGGPQLQVTSVRRSHAQQKRLYARYVAGKHAYPVAPPGCSLHEYGLAWDMVGPPELLRQLGALWTTWGGQWGGAADPIHFAVRGQICR